MKDPYFYIIKHNSSERYYAGVNYSKPDSTKLLTEGGYITSSKVVKRIIRDEGLGSFSIDRIKHFSSSDAAIQYETRFLQKINAKDNNDFLNRWNSVSDWKNSGGYKLTDETREKMRKPKSESHRSNMSESLRNRSSSIYEKTVKTRRENGEVWHSDETKENIRKANLIRWSDESNHEKHSDLMKEYYKDNPISDETREKHKMLSSGENNPMFGKTHSDDTRRKMKDAWVKRKKKKH